MLMIDPDGREYEDVNGDRVYTSGYDTGNTGSVEYVTYYQKPTDDDKSQGTPANSVEQDPAQSGEASSSPNGGEDAQSEGDGITGIPKSDVVSTLAGASAIPVNTIKGGFDAARVTQKTVSTWSKGARVLGRTSNILTAATVSYDFATGTANTSTLVNAGVAVVGAGVVFTVGIAAAPWVAAGGVVYGIVSLAGGDDWLNSQWDISDKINFVNPSGQ